MTRTLRLACVLTLLFGSGCHTVRFATRGQAGGVRKTDKAHFFLWGLAGSKDVDLDAMCPEGVQGFKSEAGADDVFLSVLTLGIYSPRTVVVDCVRAP